MGRVLTNITQQKQRPSVCHCALTSTAPSKQCQAACPFSGRKSPSCHAQHGPLPSLHAGLPPQLQTELACTLVCFSATALLGFCAAFLWAQGSKQCKYNKKLLSSQMQCKHKESSSNLKSHRSQFLPSGGALSSGLGELQFNGFG